MAQILEPTSGSLFTIGGLNKETKSIDPNALYAVNWNSLTKVEDLILVLASLGFAFSSQHPHWDTIQHLLDTENPLYPQGQPQETDFKSEEIKSPKKKKV
jgi:hypothetical protein